MNIEVVRDIKKSERDSLINELYHLQKGLCYYSGIEINLKDDINRLVICRFPVDIGMESKKNKYFLSFNSERLLYNAPGPIFNDQNNLFFCHIPKNGGSSIRNLIATGNYVPLKREERDYFYSKRMDINHLTLAAYREFLPDLFNKVISFDSYAIIRNPYERFVSSLSQRIKLYKNKRISELSLTELEQEIFEVIDYLNRNRNYSIMLEAEFIHFQRQIDYLFLHNKLIIRNVYLLKNIHILVDDLIRKLNIPKESVSFIEKKNQSLTYKSHAHYFFHKLVNYSRFNVLLRNIPNSTKKKIVGKLYKNFRETEKSKLFHRKDIKDFIESYYEDDIEYYNIVKNELQQCKSK